MLAYSASKAAVIGLTKTIGKEYAEDGICCNCIAPAVVSFAMPARTTSGIWTWGCAVVVQASEIHQPSPKFQVRTEMVAAMPAEQVKYMTDKIPMKRTGELDEICSLICFIASKPCSFTTGFCFDATGGRSTY